MSVVIGVVSALLIVALVVTLVLHLQCTQNEGRRKRHKNGVVTGATTEHRGSTSGPTLSDKAGKFISSSSNYKKIQLKPQQTSIQFYFYNTLQYLKKTFKFVFQYNKVS